MKKFYSFVLLMVALFAASTAKAAVESATELFGTWAFKADVQYLDDSYKGKVLSECDVVIKKDASGTFIAVIEGICGVEDSYQDVGRLATLEDGTVALRITNPNGGGFDAWGSLGLWMTDMEGTNPFGGQGYGSIYYNINEDGTEITIPDFSFVKISDFSAEKGEIAVKVTNIKLTLKQKEEIIYADLSGTYDFNLTSSWDYGVIENWPTSFKMNVEKKDDTNKEYKVTWTWETLGSFSFDGTFDGNTLTLPYSNMLVANDSIYLAPSNGYTTDGKATFNLTGDNLSLSSGVSFAVPFDNNADGVVDSLSYIYWYGGGIAKKPKEAPAFSYAGKYNATATVAYDASEGKIPSEGLIEIEYYEATEEYLISTFLGYDTYYLNYGGFLLKPDAEDPMKATIELKGANYLEFLEEIAGDYKYIVALDGNLQDSYINVTFTEDGTMKLGEFCIGTGTYFGTEANGLLTWYTGLTATRVPDASPQDWVGDHTVNTIAYAYTAEGATVPTTGAFKVSYDERTDEYLVEDFLGYDLYTMNYGGLLLVPDANDPHKATLECGTADFDAETMESVDLYDKDLKSTTIEVTLNDDGTVTIGDFAIAKGPWGSAPTTVIAATSAATGIATVKSSATIGAEFNLSGAKVNGAQKGITIKSVNGKYIKVLNK